MSTTPYNLLNNYTVDSLVSASDLNRRADVLASQLPGALRSASLVPGVLPLYEPQPEQTTAELLAELVAQAQTALLVTQTNGLLTAAAGAANIENPDGTLTYTQTNGLSILLQKPDEGSDDLLYIHLALQIPDADTPAASDSLLGDPPKLLFSDLENESGALLLASIDEDGTLTDRRSFTATALFALTLDAFKQRLDALVTPPPGGGGGTTLLLGTTIPIDETGPTSIKDYIDAQVILLRAEIAAAIAQITPGQRATRQPLDLVIHELQITRGELAIAQQTLQTLSQILLTTEQQQALAQNGLTGRPRVIERSQSLTIGPGFGSGENQTPDFEGPGTPKTKTAPSALPPKPTITGTNQASAVVGPGAFWAAPAMSAENNMCCRRDMTCHVRKPPI